MTKQKQLNLGGTFRLPGTSGALNRMGYGAMQLAGPQDLNSIGGIVEG
jgi:hypothetical protein